MTKELEQFIETNFPGALTARKAGVKVWDDPGTQYTSDKLCALYELGYHARDNEIFELETTVKVQDKQLSRQQNFGFVIPWWIGVLIGAIATAYFVLPFVK